MKPTDGGTGRLARGATLIELMIAILIVAILAALLAPMMQGPINEAKWTEGRTGASTVATALRAFVAENAGLTAPGTPPWTVTNGLNGSGGGFGRLGIPSSHLQGKYFDAGCYTITTVNYDGATDTLTYLVTVDVPPGSGIVPASRTLTQDGAWNP
jgi:prepilin-type N-terminal cleavage/methylation domain-containing protein